ncbi:MAG: hypothetical protein DHS20C01_19630 [marine bacterium B5-7]|nr:MAG: hypothetical protein DHS20C01_19630 [marine bacterium B5-7]
MLWPWVHRFIVTACLAIASVSAAVADGVEIPQPVAVRGEQCVEPVEVMRRNHMKMLMHQRDDTVVKGIRTPRYSLKGCIDCHAEKNDAGDFIAVNAPGQFCSTCHQYAAVRIDCFSCHATVPAGEGHGDNMEGNTQGMIGMDTSESFADGDIPHTVQNTFLQGGGSD